MSEDGKNGAPPKEDDPYIRTSVRKRTEASLKKKVGWRTGVGKNQKRTYPFFSVEDPIEEGRPEIFEQALFMLRDNDELYRLALDLHAAHCAHCNACAEACGLYQTTREIRDLPAYRAKLLVKLLKYYFSLSGRTMGGLVGAGRLTDSRIDEMLQSFYRCSMCRRCAVNCPMGLDNSLITRVGRLLLSRLNLAPRNFTISSFAQIYGIGNTSAIPKTAFRDTLDFLEEEIEDLTGIPDIFPRDKKGAHYMFIAPVSDYIMETGTLMGIALALHASGADWTVGIEYYDAINYGLFFSDEVAEKVVGRLFEEARRLKIKEILIGECGHATRAISIFKDVFGKHDIPVKSVLEYTDEAIKNGQLRLDKTKNPLPVAYHDPCNMGRGLGLFDQPRRIIEASAMQLVEFDKNRENALCCGGGGGSVTVEDLHDFRMKTSGKMMAEQIRKSGVKIIAAPCANCKKQLKELSAYHKLNIEVIGVHDLIANALVFD